MRVSSVVSQIVCYVESRFYKFIKSVKDSIRENGSVESRFYKIVHFCLRMRSNGGGVTPVAKSRLDYKIDSAVVQNVEYSQKVIVSKIRLDSKFYNDIDFIQENKDVIVSKTKHSAQRSMDCHALPQNTCNKSRNDDKNIESRFYKKALKRIKKLDSIESKNIRKSTSVIESKSIKVLLGSALLLSGSAYAAIDITNYIYNFQNQQNNTNQGNADGIYYSVDMNTWRTACTIFTPCEVTMEFLNGTLILGNNSKNPNNVNGNTNFGKDGFLGFTQAEFYAKDIYLTGNMISGNGIATGGGATININGTSQPVTGGALRNGNITAESLNIFVKRAGTQGSATRLQAKTITINNSNLRIGNVDGADSGIHIGNQNNHNESEMITINNTHVTGDGGVFRVYAKNSNLNFSGLNGDGGTFDLRFANYSNLNFNDESINVANFNFYAKDTNLHGDMQKGHIKTENGVQNFYAEMLRLRKGMNTNQQLSANKIDIGNLQFWIPDFAGTSHAGTLTFNAIAKDSINIINLLTRQAGGGSGSTINFYAKNTLNVANDIVMSAQIAGISDSHFRIEAKDGATSYDINAKNVYFDGDNVTGASKAYLVLDGKNVNITGSMSGRTQNHINVYASENININNINFAQDICITESCGGSINLGATKNVYIKSIEGRTNETEAGIRAGNSVNIKSQNMYIGKMEAISLVLPDLIDGNKSKLDFSNVTGEKVIDDAYMRYGSVFGNNFHINNLTIWKGKLDRVTSLHPQIFDAVSRFESNIGKSFINSVGLEIATSNTSDAAALWFTGGGDILNMNYVNARASSYLNAQSIKEQNINQFDIAGADAFLGNAIFNNITSTRTQLWITANSRITANALNINETLHLKNSSVNAGAMTINVSNSPTGFDVNQDFSKYLKLDVDSKTLKSMNAGDLANLIEQNKDKITADNQNASGTYITTSDNKSYVLLPGIKQIGIEGYNNAISAKNAGNLLIEQTKLEKGVVGNYGVIKLDNRCDESTKQCTTGQTAELGINGDLKNYNTIDIGAGSKTLVVGNVYNEGNIVFRVQSDVNNLAESRNGQLVVNDGSFNIDVSPGKVGGMRADITSANSLANLRLKKDGDVALNSNTYRLVEVNNARINYVYTYGDYTTTFTAGLNGQASINTIKNNGEQCNNADCETNLGNDTQQETKWTQGGLKNPWDMDKSQVDSNNGGKVEKPLGENMNNDSILGRPSDEEIKIEKPSQADKYADCKINGTEKYCGFGNDKNATEAERGYDYAIERMKNSFTITYQGGNIDGKYLQVEKVVTPQVIGFNVIKKEIFNPSGSEIPLCNAESSSFDCVLYMEAGGNNSWINALKKESKNSYNILKDLFYNENSELLMLIQLDQSLAISRNLDYFLEVGRTLDTTMQHVSSLENKSSTLQTLNLAMDSAKSNRLARVAYFQSPEYEALAFQEYRANVEKASELASQVRALRNNYAFNGNIESKGVKVASIESNNLESNNAVMDDSDSNNPNAAHHPIISVAAVANHHSNTETIYDTADNTDSNNNEAWFNTIADLIVRFSTRGENPNNLWANAIGNVSFSTTGSNQLYGFNAGYDYYSKLLHTAFGLYVGYGYGIFTGNNNGYISNNSQNLFAGIYTRTFIGNNEFDMTISASRGFVNESIQAQKRGFDLLDLFNQKYHYNVTNLEGNVTYGYAFVLKKGYTLKPFLGASYYISTSTGYNRQASGIFEIDTSDNARHAIGVNVGIEGRKYFKNQSYIFLNAQFRQDVYVLKDNLDSKRLSSSNVSNTESNLAFTFDYRGDSLRSNMFVTAGGELALGRFYINTSLTSHTSVISKAFGFGANAGIRFVF
ncbi:vacuolating cytotoxin domain-containing protein [Helicobacter saguini]|uniref:Autotransporter domain-containing protein n=1 Tax=Helicobacter saguini TaxID=1548018 RepID=A0A6L7DAU8_9HELI|nr:vacuolating cytotoxin domain-containing protein [Helicobacter saguini]MWV62721.1 autotransporter domain-containing protein [Helicobacter saguini]MWV68959.1 autotransporter domain-containing protein [Helicobacter saguini]MWV71488.1 autotransporter domain-containing protein [Helicobacter saguini]